MHISEEERGVPDLLTYIYLIHTKTKITILMHQAKFSKILFMVRGTVLHQTHSSE